MSGGNCQSSQSTTQKGGGGTWHTVGAHNLRINVFGDELADVTYYADTEFGFIKN